MLQKKVESMSHQELKEYVLEIILTRQKILLAQKRKWKHGEKCQIFWRTI